MSEAIAAGLRAFVEELVRGGLREAVICPGSRSTPLALALAAHEGLRVHVLLDERSASFAALGMARAARRPVAVLVTSGTAAAELLPAAAEAHLAHVPLVLLTADRPSELRDRGAAQTIDQVGIFGSHVVWAAEVPLIDGAAVTLAHLRWLAGRALAEARGGARAAGPVHLDVPFREPLVPGGPLGAEPDLAGAPFVRAIGGRRTLDKADLDALAVRLRRVERGLIVAGPDDDPELPAAIGRLAAATGFPVLTDGLAGARRGGTAVGDDLVVRPSPWLEAHRPELVIRTGAIPTSRWLNELVAHPAHALWVLDGDAGWRQPAARPSVLIGADPVRTIAGWVRRLDAMATMGERVTPGSAVDPMPLTPWGRDWQEAAAAVGAACDSWLTALEEPFEGLPLRILPDVVTDPTLLWVGSSMPVRDLDAWFAGSPHIRTIASRGANGIDGVTSAAAGAAAVHDGPVVLVTGDVSFVHDVGALVTARLLGVPLTIVVTDNDGGGIFSFLAQASADRPDVGLPDRFEQLFGTPHGTPIAAVATALGAVVREVDHRTLRRALRDAIADRTPGVRLLRYPTDRRRNVELHADVARVAADALAGLGAAPR